MQYSCLRDPPTGFHLVQLSRAFERRTDVPSDGSYQDAFPRHDTIFRVMP